MKNRQKSGTYIVFLLLTLSLIAVVPVINSENTTVVGMDGVNIPKGGSNWGFLTVNDVSNLGSCDVTLSWDPGIVTVTDVNDSDFDSMDYYVDDTAGVLSVNAFSYDAMNGDFTVAKVTFEPASGASVGDECDLEITDSLLLTAYPIPSDIVHDGQNGTAHITKSSSGDDGTSTIVNKPPIADASESQTSGFVGESINFDGSLSTDSDGTIDLYEWDWDDDGVYDTSSASSSATHSFDAADTYIVTLRVTDNEGATNEATINVEISKANNPPTDLEVEGETKGHKNTEYAYTATATDPDENDTIRYIFSWDDGTNDTMSSFLTSGTTFNTSHSWASYGLYTINVYAEDNGSARSATTKLTVLIDTHWVKDIGYLIDDDGDGTYDTFYSNATKEQTDVEKQDDGTYLIDSDGDGEWDYVYDIETGTLTEYSGEPTTEPDNFALIVLAIIVILFLIILGYLVKRSNDKKKAQKKAAEKKSQPKKKTTSKKSKK